MAVRFEIKNWEECFRDIFQDKNKLKIDLLKYAFNEFRMISDDFQSAIGAPVSANPIRISVFDGTEKKEIDKHEFIDSETVIAKDTVTVRSATELVNRSVNGELRITNKWFITMITYFLANQEEFTDKKYSVTKEQLKKLFNNIRPLGDQNKRKELTNWYNQYIDFVFKANDWLSGSDIKEVINPFWRINDFKVEEDFHFRINLQDIPPPEIPNIEEGIDNTSHDVEKEEPLRESVSGSQGVNSKLEISIQNVFSFNKARLWLIITGVILLVGGISYFFIPNNITLIADNNNYYNNSNVLKRDTVEDYINWQCKFENSNAYKIVILPFKSRIKLGNSDKDIGAEIEERLNKLNLEDTLGIQVHYCTDFVYDKKPSDGNDENYYRRIMRELNASHIIYGVTKDTIPNSELTKVRIGYQTDLVSNYESRLSCKNGFEYNLTSFDELANGFLLEDIEYVVYYNAILSILSDRNLLNQRRCLKYFQRIEERNIQTPEFMCVKLTVFHNLRMNSRILELEDELLEGIDNYKSPILKQKVLLSLGTANINISSESAIRYFEQALEIKETGNLYYLLGNHYRFNGLYDIAIEYFDKGLQLSNSSNEMASLYDSKQKAYHSQGKYQEALEMSEKSIEYEPYGECYWLNKGTNMYMLGEIDGALKTIDYSISLDSENADAYEWKGKIFLSQGKPYDAHLSFNRALEINPISGPWNYMYKKRTNDKEYSELVKMVNNQIKYGGEDSELLLVECMLRLVNSDSIGAVRVMNRLNELEEYHQIIVCEHGQITDLRFESENYKEYQNVLMVESRDSDPFHSHHWSNLRVNISLYDSTMVANREFINIMGGIEDSLFFESNTFSLSDYIIYDLTSVK